MGMCQSWDMDHPTKNASVDDFSDNQGEKRALSKKKRERHFSLGHTVAGEILQRLSQLYFTTDYASCPAQKVAKDFGHFNMIETKGPKTSNVKLGAQGFLQK